MAAAMQSNASRAPEGYTPWDLDEPPAPPLLLGTPGSDTLAGSAGSDIVRAGAGDDLLFYRLADQQPGTHDTYHGGQGQDTLELVFTRKQLAQAGFLDSLAQQLRDFRDMVAAQALPTGELSAARDATFTFSFGDWQLTVSRIEEVRVAPTLASVAFRVAEGGATDVRWANFGYSDPGAPDVVMTAVWVEGGRFEVLDVAGWTVANAFTGAQLANGQVRFVHDGSEFSPIVYLRASEGGSISNTVMTKVDYMPVNDAPELLGANLPLPALSNVVFAPLSGQNFRVFDPDHALATLTFQVSDCQGGGIYLRTQGPPALLTRVDSFTGQDLVTGRIYWRLDGSGTPDQFTVQVSDGEYSSAAMVVNAGLALVGTAGPDTLDGAIAGDSLLGQGSNDTLRGNAMADNLDGGSGDDVLWGGDGADRLLGGAGNGMPTGGNDTLHGGSGWDVLDGMDGDDVLFGDEGDDTLVGGVGNDTLVGGLDTDRLSGGPGNDSMEGGDGNDGLDGGDGGDTLQGGAGDDWLFGGNGADLLDGGGGSDTLVGGTGTDTLTGGAGPDYFLFSAPLQAADGSPINVDTIQDFSSDEGDMIVLRTIANSVFESLQGVDARDVFGTYVWYDPFTGALSYDADGPAGSGIAVNFALLANRPATMQASDFLVASV